MNKKFLKTLKGDIIEGPIVIQTKFFEDKRGLFYEGWNLKTFNNLISNRIDFVQDNFSYSKKGVIRGLHYQLEPFIQGKLIRCLKGSIFDVIVDLRKESKTFLDWTSIDLSDENFKQLWVPRGFAHGFLTTSSEALVSYKVDNYWNEKYERTIKWNDKEININWPLKENELNIPYLSNKDASAQSITEAKLRGDIFK